MLFGDNDNRFNGYAIEAFEKFAHLKIDDSDERVWEIARESEDVPNLSEFYNFLVAGDIENFFSDFCPGLIKVETDACGYTTDSITLTSIATGDTLEIDTQNEG